MRFTTTAIALLLLLAAAPVMAQDRPVDWTLWGTFADIQGDNDLGDGFTMEADSGMGLGLSANFFITERFSTEIAIFTIDTEAEMEFGDTEEFGYDLGNVDIIPVTLGLQYHFVSGSRWDPYIGAGAAWISASDLESDDLDTLGIGTVELDDETTWFANLGLGYRFGEQVGIAFDVRYMPYEPTSTSKATGATEELELSPLMASLGIRVRF